MGYQARILLDSIGPTGARLTTWELTYPRFVHAELMTHRSFSRNSSSSRAIPIEKLIAKVVEDPALPVEWGKNQAGMQAKELLDEETAAKCKDVWLRGRDEMVKIAYELNALGLHKQLVNRVIEPWMHITVLVSATNFMNWYGLRAHAEAQPEIAWVAKEMIREITKSTPKQLSKDEWHLPLMPDKQDLILAGFPLYEILMICAGRCARVSYLTHEGKREPKADLILAERLLKSGHMSPFEHAGKALDKLWWSGNFRGFEQYRKTLPNESLFMHNENFEALKNVEGLSITEIWK